MSQFNVPCIVLVLFLVGPVFSYSVVMDNIGYFDYRTFIGRYCFKYDFIGCLIQLDIILRMYCNIKSTGLPLGLFSTDVFWNHSCLAVFLFLAHSTLFDRTWYFVITRFYWNRRQ